MTHYIYMLITLSLASIADAIRLCVEMSGLPENKKEPIRFVLGRWWLIMVFMAGVIWYRG